jgi:hypothetical protein
MNTSRKKSSPNMMNNATDLSIPTAESSNSLGDNRKHGATNTDWSKLGIYLPGNVKRWIKLAKDSIATVAPEKLRKWQDFTITEQEERGWLDKEVVEQRRTIIDLSKLIKKQLKLMQDLESRLGVESEALETMVGSLEKRGLVIKQIARQSRSRTT